jgi:hypothetical protein
MTLRLNGSTSGYTEIDAPAVAGSNTLVLPGGNGSANQRLVTNGSGTLSFSSDVMLSAGSAGSPSLYFSGNTNTGMWSPAADTLAWSTGGSERVRVDSSGNFLAGRTSTLFASSHTFDSAGTAVLGLRNSTATAGKYWQTGPDGGNSYKVYNQNSVGMFMSDGATAWSSSSDERQKNILEPITDAVSKLASLRTVIGSYKSDKEQTRRAFLIAQDVQKVLPEAVTTAPDGFLGVAYTDLIPLLVAALKESKSYIESLEARIAALEATP